jgi:hypothetical protein
MTTGIEDILQQQEEGETSNEETPPETTENENAEGKVEKAEESAKDKGEEVEAIDPSKVVEETPAVPPDNTELNELRQFIREQRKEIAAMRAKLSRVQEQGVVDDEGNTTITYTPLEKLQQELHNVAISKAPVLEVLVEAMEANPKYSDIYEVCSKNNFDDIFEMAATTISRNEGRDFNEVLLQLELEVWKKPNPYKFMYGVIKENHPKYKDKDKTPVEKKDVLKEALKPPASIPAKKVLEAKEAPGSVAAAGAGENLGTGAWTAAKIDDLEESELHQVPPEIYKKYMMGKLK